MYHYNLNISIFFLESRKSAWFREVPALEGFTNNYIVNPEITAENIAASDIIIWGKPVCKNDLVLLSKYKKKDAVLVLLCNREELMKADNWTAVADNIWPRILQKNIMQGLYKRLLTNFKIYCDNKLTESYLNALINNMPDMVWFKNVSGIHTKVNDKFCDVVGKKREEIIGNNHCTIWNIAPEEYAKNEFVCMETEAPVIQQAKSFMFEEKVKLGDDIHFLNTYKSPVFDKNHKVIGTVGYARDITDLWNQSTELRLILNYLPLAIMVTDIDENIKVVNTAFCETFATKPELIEGNCVKHWQEEEYSAKVSLLRREEKPIGLNIIFNLINKKGENLTISSLRKALQNSEGKIIGYVYSFENLLEERREAATNYKNSITDELTGVFNRRHYRAMVGEYVQKGMQFSVAEIDCDDLKYVNDSFGHSTGDDYLQTVVNVIKGKMLPSEVLCRIGGDEFVMLSIKRTKKEMLAMLKSVNKFLCEMELKYPASISFGAEYIENVDFEAYRKGIHSADKQLYSMKKTKHIER